MKLITIIASFLFVTIVILLVPASTTDSDGWQCSSKFSKCYKYMEARIGREKAEDRCLSMESHLTSIHSADESNFIRKLTTDQSKNVWLGAIRLKDKWQWADESKFDFDPRNSEDKKERNDYDCLGIHKDKLKALKCNWGMGYVCAKTYTNANNPDNNVNGGATTGKLSMTLLALLTFVRKVIA